MPNTQVQSATHLLSEEEGHRSSEFLARTSKFLIPVYPVDHLSISRIHLIHPFNAFHAKVIEVFCPPFQPPGERR
jgi:hypothetical protein